MLLGRFPVFLAALFIYGIGSGVSEQQRRLSAVDIYPPELRAKGLGFVVTGSLIGAAGGPLLISAAGFLSHARGIDQVSMAWFLVPLLLIPSLGLVLLIRPDPREIAVSLAHYYPGYRGAERGPASMAPTKSVTLMTFLRHYPQLVAFVCMFVLYANMSMMMALTPMTMSSIGLPLAAISITVAVHVLGMYGLSLPIGAIADSLGRRRVLFAGLGLSTAGTVLVALTVVYPLMMLGLFLIGVGWSCGNISTAALVADTTPPTIRGQAMGANASFSAAASVVAPLLGGVLVQFFGTASLVAFTLIIVMPTLALLIRLQETQPGIFAHERVW